MEEDANAIVAQAEKEYVVAIEKATRKRRMIVAEADANLIREVRAASERLAEIRARYKVEVQA